MIVEEEQQGKERAEYGKSVLKMLSAKLSERFGRGFSVDNLQNMRRFFQVYSVSGIFEKPSRKLDDEQNVDNLIRQKASAKSPDFAIAWFHYLILMRIENADERKFCKLDLMNG